MTEKLVYYFVFQNSHLLIAKNGDIKCIPSSITKMQPSFLRQLAIGHFHHATIYCAELAAEFSLSDDFTAIPLRKAFELIEPVWHQALVAAYSIINWDKNHQYCGRCANPTIRQTTIFERVCTVCSLTFYPRISPSIIVLIQKEDQLLMARSPHFNPGIYALIAGFVEVGESLEAAVHREVKEEVGIEIKNLRYFGSQPWPFPDSLMVGFIADYATGELVINQTEIEAAGWYRFDNLPGRPSFKLSIATKLIDHFVAEQQKKHIKQ